MLSAESMSAVGESEMRGAVGKPDVNCCGTMQRLEVSANVRAMAAFLKDLRSGDKAIVSRILSRNGPEVRRRVAEGG